MAATVSIKLPAVPPADLDRALGAVASAGASEIELIDDADPIAILALFRDETPQSARARIEAALRDMGLIAAVLEARESAVLDQGSTKALGLGPILLGTRIGPLAILPPGRPRPQGTAETLVLESEGAFGSGFHATTALCLERLVELPPAAAFLDVGTGSGILALAALILGTSTAVATDSDPSALEVARANAGRNQLEDRIVFSGRDPGELGRTFPLIAANLTAAPLMALAPSIVRAIAPGGLILLSGVRHDQATEVVHSYERFGLHAIARAARDGWLRIELIPSW